MLKKQTIRGQRKCLNSKFHALSDHQTTVTVCFVLCRVLIWLRQFFHVKTTDFLGVSSVTHYFQCRQQKAVVLNFVLSMQQHLLQVKVPGIEFTALSRDEDQKATVIHRAAEAGQLDCLKFLMGTLLSHSSTPQDATTLVDIADRTPAMLALQVSTAQTVYLKFHPQRVRRYSLLFIVQSLSEDQHSRTNSFWLTIQNNEWTWSAIRPPRNNSLFRVTRPTVFFHPTAKCFFIVLANVHPWF